MKIKEYFGSKAGWGILSTANGEGKVDSAVFAKPHFVDEDTLLLVMGNKLTHRNLQSNPYAVYLFKEEGPGYEGRRLYLKKLKESDEPEEIERTCKDAWPGAYGSGYCTKGQFIVYFRVESVLPLVGG
jgi:hypothetical protein